MAERSGACGGGVSAWTPEVMVLARSLLVSASLFGWDRHVLLVVLFVDPNEESLCGALESCE